MSIVALLMVAIAVLPALGLVTWVWLTTACESDDLGSFVGFDGMHFDGLEGHLTRTGFDRRRVFRSTRRIT